GFALTPIPEGTAAIVWGDDESQGAWLDRIDGIEGHREVRPGVRLVWSRPRRWFIPPAGFSTGPPDRGTHGGIRTRNQVAIVAGGHPEAIALARTIGARPQVEATEWAAHVTGLLGMSPIR